MNQACIINDSDVKSKNLEIFLISSLTIILSLVGFIYYTIVGYSVVETLSGSLELTTPPIYMIPIFSILGIIFGELFFNYISKNDHNSWVILFVELIILVFLSYLRIAIIIPISGYSMILTYFLLKQIVSHKNKYKIRISIGFSILIITLYYKLLIWNDPITLIFGFLVGFFIFSAGFYYKKVFS
ncbi:MAG: hypothetical protein HeimC3_38580 [Candidatus Heimdallarchaeota archaeon LC_3]|nr:MAG: hypothetical protein HeimC3_38580 [Candidatus Heimdallarchaeota archaeon LC_3]